MATRQLKLIEPVRLRAKVVHGFGRGSTELGFPTANLQIRWDGADGSVPLSEDEKTVLNFARNNDTGIYAALSCVEDGPDRGIYKVAMSMGWNPTFTDVKEKTIEPWILHKFSDNFYDCHLRLLVLAYIRPELKFESFDQLIQEIKADGDYCNEMLDGPNLKKFFNEDFLASVSTPPPKGGLQVSPTKAEGSASMDDSVGCDLRPVLQLLQSADPTREQCARLLLVQAEDEEEGASGSSRATCHMAKVAEELRTLSDFKLALVSAASSGRAQAAADVVSSHFPGVLRTEYAALDDSSSEDSSLTGLGSMLEKHRGGTVMLVLDEPVNKALLAKLLQQAGHLNAADTPQRSGCVNIIDVFFDEGSSAPKTAVVRGLDLVVAQSGL